MKLIYSKVFYSLILVVLTTLSSYGQKQNGKFYTISDTSELKRVIQKEVEKFEASQTINQDSLIDLFTNALRLKDTLSAVELSKKVCTTYRYNLGDKDAIQWIGKCIKLIDTPDQRHSGKLYNTLGNFYQRLGYEINALRYYFKSLEWFKRYDENKSSYALGNIALIYYNLEDYEKALEYSLETQTYANKIENKDDRLYNNVYDYNLIGSIYTDLNKNDQAASYFKKAVKAAEELDDSDLLLSSICELIALYKKTKNYDNCRRLIDEGDRLIETQDNKSIRYLTYFEILKSSFFLQTNQASKAIHPSDLDVEAKFLLKNKYEYAIEYFDVKGDAENIKKYYDILLSELEETNIANKKDVIANIEIEYLAKELKEDNIKLEQESQKRTNIIYLISILLCTILGLFLLQRYNNNKTKKLNLSLESKTKELKMSNQQLTTSYEELERFNFIASHDLKTPLRSIISFSGLLQGKLLETKDESITNALHFIKEGGNQMHELIEGVEFYLNIPDLIKKGSESLKTEDLEHFISKVSKLSLERAKKNAFVELHSLLPSIKHSASMISILFENIIDNGLKFNQSHAPCVKIKGKNKGTYYSLQFEDNGIGIKEEFLDSIFKMFTKLNNQNDYKGSGLGLATCKKIITELGGNINVKSELGKGTTFEVQMPIELFENRTHDFVSKDPVVSIHSN